MHRDPARARLPARARAALLRLQARQRHPGRRHAEADRPRRRPPHRRRTSPRSTAPSGTRRRRSPTTGPTSPSDLYTVGRTLAVLIIEFHGYQSTFVALAAATEDIVPLFAAARLAPPSARSRARRRSPTTGSSPPTRSATSCSACCARSRSTAAAARHGSHPVHVVRVAERRRLDARMAPSCRRSGSSPRPDGAVDRGRVGRPTQRSAWPRSTRRPGRPSRCALAKVRAAIDAGEADRRRRAHRRILEENPWEWRAVWLGGLNALAAGDNAAAISVVQHRLRPGPGRARPEAGARARLRTRRRRSTSPSRSTASAPRSDAAYSAPARSASRASPQPHDDLDGALDRARGHRPHQPGLDRRQGSPEPDCSPRRRAEPATWRPSTPRRSGSAQSGNDPYDPRTSGGWWVLETALAAGENPPVIDPAARIAGVPATEVDLRRALESTWRAAAQHSEDGEDRVRCVDRANAVRPRTLV